MLATNGWHKTQKLARQNDGSLIAEFRLSDTEEIKRWILSFGRHAEVLQPEELRADIAEEIRVTFVQYAGVDRARTSSQRDEVS
jgi:predicted DNA-binding transcriptional regulator YafY